MVYRTSAKHALNGPSTALLPIAAQSRSLPPMPASRHASAAGKCAATMAAPMALTILIVTTQSARAEQAPEGAPAAWRGEGGGGGTTLHPPAVPQGFHPATPPLVGVGPGRAPPRAQDPAQ